jgi:hypothetical protein
MENSLNYVDHDGLCQTVRGCSTYTDKAGRHWLHCEITDTNLAYKASSREAMLLSALDSALWYVEHYKKQSDALQAFKNRFDSFVEAETEN